MEIEYTIKIKEEHNPPTFNKDFGKGVIAKQIVDFKGAKLDDLDSPNLQRQIYEFSEKLKNDWFEVVYKIKE